jgi:hypothetical protein
MAMEAVGIKSYNTFKKTLDDLVEWGFLKMIERSKNQYSANIIALSNFDKAPTKALDKALLKHGTKQSESTQQSTDSINKQETNKPFNYKQGDSDHPFKSEMQNDPIDVPKDLQEVLDYCKQINIPIGRGKVFHAYYDDANWCFTRGGQFIPVANWRQKLVNDINRGWHEAEPEQAQPQFLNE